MNAMIAPLIDDLEASASDLALAVMAARTNGKPGNCERLEKLLVRENP
jgi:hypothetical protein